MQSEFESGVENVQFGVEKMYQFRRNKMDNRQVSSNLIWPLKMSSMYRNWHVGHLYRFYRHVIHVNIQLYHNSCAQLLLHETRNKRGRHRRKMKQNLDLNILS